MSKELRMGVKEAAEKATSELEPGPERADSMGTLERLREVAEILREAGVAFYPALAERQVEAFEARYGVRLPAAYRLFLLHVGDGIASERSCDMLTRLGTVLEDVPEGWHGLGQARDAFPYEWDSILSGGVVPNEEGEGEETGQTDDERDQEDIERYESCRRVLWEDIVKGTLPLGAPGGLDCLFFLVLNGPKRGTVWHLHEWAFPDMSWSVNLEACGDFADWLETCDDPY